MGSLPWSGYSVSQAPQLPFFGFLLIVLWLICACFGLSLVFRSGHALGMTNTGHFAVWCLIFLLVTLQMTTTLRPIIGSEEKLVNFEEKKFFSELLVRASDAGTLRLGFLHIQQQEH